MPAEIGEPWTDADHAAMPAFDSGLAEAIVRLLRPDGVPGWFGRRAVDWGGGLGLYLDELASMGVLTTVVEPLVSEQFPHLYVPLSMARPVHLTPCYLTICMEVLEHIPRSYHETALDNVAWAIEPGGWLVFSAATPGQGGCGHVAERPEAEWREELSSRGLVEDPARTAELRSAATLSWFRKNVMAWRRQ